MAIFSLKELKALTGQNYTVFVPDAKGNLTSTAIHVALPPVIFSTDPADTIDTSKCAANGDCSVKLTGTNIDLIGRVLLNTKDGGDQAAEGFFFPATKTAVFRQIVLTGLKKNNTFRLQAVTPDDNTAILPSVPMKVTHP